MNYVSVDIDPDDILYQLDDEDIIEELRTRLVRYKARKDDCELDSLIYDLNKTIKSVIEKKIDVNQDDYLDFFAKQKLQKVYDNLDRFTEEEFVVFLKNKGEIVF